MILSLFLINIILHLVVALFSIIVRLPKLEVDQLDVFKVQFQQLIQRNPITSCSDDVLETHDFEVVFDRNRLVKRPGYEILLEDVNEGRFICDIDLKLDLVYKKERIVIAFK